MRHLRQIEERTYSEELEVSSIQKTFKLAIAFQGKHLWAKPGLALI